jgi:hypothetical protein
MYMVSLNTWLPKTGSKEIDDGTGSPWRSESTSQTSARPTCQEIIVTGNMSCCTKIAEV